MAVSTGVSAERDNYPPAAWLRDTGWTVPTIRDDARPSAAAYGLTGFPYLVLLDGQGRVVRRMEGETPPEAIVAAAAALVGAAPGASQH